MANSKASELAAANLTGGELIYIVKGGNSRKATLGATGALLMEDTGQTQALTTLGGAATGLALFRAATQAAAFLALGVTAYAQTVLDDTGQTKVQATLGLLPGTNVQAFHAYLSDIAALNLAHGDILYFDTGSIKNLPAGTSGRFLQTLGAGVDPIWARVPQGWVNFNGTGTVAIRASNNVTSVTDNGTGDYTITLTNNLTDANYAASVTVTQDVSATYNVGAGIHESTAPTSSALRILIQRADGTDNDAPQVHVVFFR